MQNIVKPTLKKELIQCNSDDDYEIEMLPSPNTIE